MNDQRSERRSHSSDDSDQFDTQASLAKLDTEMRKQLSLLQTRLETRPKWEDMRKLLTETKTTLMKDWMRKDRDNQQ